jgi:uncharacterized delta-60 repeat protein
MVVQPDGKIVVAGLAEPEFGAVVRFGPDGDLDRGFGNGGIVIDRRFRPFRVVALRPDGRIVAGAWEGSENLGRSPLLLSLLPDGRPDSPFGRRAAAGPEQIDEGLVPASILPTVDGGLVVAGTAKWIERTWESHADIVSLDQAGGFVDLLGTIPGDLKPRHAWNDLAGLLARPDGSLVMAGDTHWPAEDNTLLARFAPGSSSFDPSFGGGAGLVRQKFATFAATRGERANAIVEDAGRLVVAGSAGVRPMVARFDGDGVLDTSFGEGGSSGWQMPGPRYGEATAVSVAPDGAIVVALTLADEFESGTDNLCRDCREAAIARFRPDGSFDPSFGGGLGVVRFGAGAGRQRFARGEDIAILPSGEIVASAMSLAGRSRLIVARFGSDGRPDFRFDGDGVATALPCLGSEVRQRQTRCLPSARVGLQAHASGRSAPGLRLRVRTNLPWGEVSRAEIYLPPQLESRMWGALAYTVVADGEAERVHMVEGRAFKHGINAEVFGGAKDVTVLIPPNCLRWVERAMPGRKLVFRVRVHFEHAGMQTVTLRRFP